MMAVDFLLSSSSVKAGLVGVCEGGGVAVSRFAVHTTGNKNQWQSYSTNLNLCKQQLAKVHIIAKMFVL